MIPILYNQEQKFIFRNFTLGAENDNIIEFSS